MKQFCSIIDIFTTTQYSDSFDTEKKEKTKKKKKKSYELNSVVTRTVNILTTNELVKLTIV